MVLYNYKDEDGTVHCKRFTTSSVVIPPQDTLCGATGRFVSTRENPTCEDCINELKYAVITAQYLAQGGYGS